MDEEICFPCYQPVSPSAEESRNRKRKRLEGEEDLPGTVENPLYDVPKDQRVEGLFYWTDCGKSISMWNGKKYVCEHGRQRNVCKECRGSSICPHGKVRSRCKECGGAEICAHGRQRSHCKECGGSQICPHGRVRNVCKECDGSSICPHGRVRNECKECGGSRICPHGRKRNECKECGGSRICPHGRKRTGCKECDGSQICPHKRIRSECKECVTVEKMQESKRWCSICCNKRIGNSRIRAGMTMCAECDKTVPDRIEVQLRPKLVEMVGFEPSALDDTLFGTDSAMCDVVKRRRPDFLWQSKRVVICVECDEKGGHGSLNYTPECDGGWMTDMTVALTELHQRQFGKAPFIFFLRFNPDERHRKQTRVDLDQRLKVVADRVNEIRALKDFKGLRRGVPMVEYYYYHSKCMQMIAYTRDRPDAFRVLKVVQ
jgi:hypothetical protein